MIRKPTAAELNALDLTELNNLISNDNYGKVHFLKSAGQEHYRLLAWLSILFVNEELHEYGTLMGISSVALSFNRSNLVKTHDIRLYECGPLPGNVERRVITEPLWDELKKTKFVFYDTDHNGTLERQFIEGLQRIGWKGVVLFDDIYFNEPMKQFWAELQLPKEDWTDIGHHSGTGIVYFN